MRPRCTLPRLAAACVLLVVTAFYLSAMVGNATPHRGDRVRQEQPISEIAP